MIRVKGLTRNPCYLVQVRQDIYLHTKSHLWGRVMNQIIAVMGSVRFGLPHFTAHLLSATALWALAVYLGGLMTPYRKLPLIRQGNMAVTIAYGGAALSLAIPLAFCLASSVSIADIVIWGAVSMLFQLAAFYVTSLILPGLGRRLEAGEVTSALFLSMLRIGFAFLNAAAVA